MERNNRTEPYPPGTKCVITWCPFSGEGVNLGDIVTVGEISFVSGQGGWLDFTNTGFHGLLLQELPEQEMEKFRVAYPVAWMLPLEDDEDQQGSTEMDRELELS